VSKEPLSKKIRKKKSVFLFFFFGLLASFFCCVPPLLVPVFSLSVHVTRQNKFAESAKHPILPIRQEATVKFNRGHVEEEIEK
jgi:thiol:disulfide interchange protein